MTNERKCSFCGSKEEDVLMIAGPDNVKICKECVIKCNNIIFKADMKINIDIYKYLFQEVGDIDAFDQMVDSRYDYIHIRALETFHEEKL